MTDLLHEQETHRHLLEMLKAMQLMFAVFLPVAVLCFTLSHGQLASLTEGAGVWVLAVNLAAGCPWQTPYNSVPF